jgi:pimeloyl-ACP methyl ester carboxylesterase
MRFETFGNPGAAKCGLMLHAMGVNSAQFREIADLLSCDYYLILPTFDGHHADGKTEFTTIEDQADKILAYLREQEISKIDFICGSSLGALVAYEIYLRGQLSVRKYVLDGGPFFRLGSAKKFVMCRLFWLPFVLLKTCPRLTVLGERKFGISLTAIAVKVSSFITKRDINNIVSSMGHARIPETLREDSQLVFHYGGRENALRSFKRFRHLSGYELIVKEGYGHCQFVMGKSAEYAALLRE